MPEAQLVETRIVNLLHFQTLVASKAARMRLAAPGRQLVDFGLRRPQGTSPWRARFRRPGTPLAASRWGWRR